MFQSTPKPQNPKTPKPRLIRTKKNFLKSLFHEPEFDLIPYYAWRSIFESRFIDKGVRIFHCKFWRWYFDNRGLLHIKKGVIEGRWLNISGCKVFSQSSDKPWRPIPFPMLRRIFDHLL